MRFAGRTYIIPGASRGIGRSLALTLGKEHANVGINFRSHPAEAQAVADEITQAGGKALLLQADVASQPAVGEMVSKTIAAFGKLLDLLSVEKEEVGDADREIGLDYLIPVTGEDIVEFAITEDA